jgi:UDP-galactopyranose mutase
MVDDVVCFSHLRWGFVYQRPNHLMSRCARSRRVLFFEEPVFDAVTPRTTMSRVSARLTTVVPHLRPGTPPAEAVRAQRAMIDELAARLDLRRPAAWLYTPMAVDVACQLEPSVVVYDCMDELAAFDGAPADLPAKERQLFARADLVFTGGSSLYEAKRRHHPRVFAFPSSVDAAHFATAAHGLPAPDDQSDIPSPRLGFFGVLDERLDRALLARMADAHPEWHVVMIGPVAKIDPASLPDRPNLHYLGPKTYDELPAYLGGWDVAIMPFALNDATRFISPTKTLEYLAAGKPVVSTPIRDVVRPFGERGLVRVGGGEGFLQALAEALAERGTDREAARRVAAAACVGATSWDRTWDQMLALVLDAAGSCTGHGARDRSPCSIT